MIEQIKKLRVEIDGLSQLVKELGLCHWILNDCLIVGNEKQRAYNSLILAKAWLGKILEELGNKTPYESDGNRHSVNDIEPTADKSNVIEALNWKGLNHIEKIDELRQKIKNIIFSIQVLKQELQDFLDNEVSIECNIARTNCYNHLSEARFWLGFELSRIKNETKLKY